MRTRNRVGVEAKKRLMEAKAEIAPEVVVAIRQCHAAGMKTNDLVNKFGISQSRVSNIVNNRTYTY